MSTTQTGESGTPANAPQTRLGDTSSASSAGTPGSTRAPKLDKPANLPLQKWVFFPAAGLITLGVLLAALFPTQTTDVLNTLQSTVINGIGWYYVAIIAVFIVFALWIGLSRYGDIKLGKDDDEPEFSVMSWFALLFAAGMGIGLVFWGAAEPLNHFASPPPGVEGDPVQIAQRAMSQTFLHWGFHAWAIYAVVGVAIAYSVFRKGNPISIRWTLEPLFGKKRIKGGFGNLIDVVALIGTTFGVATSLGLGVMQISAGLQSTGALEIAPETENLVRTGLILGIMTLTLASVVSGVGKGMKWLSNINLILAGVLLLAVLFLGPTLFLLREFVQSIGNYLQNVIGLTFNTFAFRGAEGEAWQAAWTTFYWGWWISWAPFVGIFIARISKGRSVREFVAAVLVVPSLVGFLWFSVMGGTALYRELFGQGGLIDAEGAVDTNTALFTMLGDLPGGLLLSIGAMILVTIFFITSADSGALVMGMLSTGGDPEPRNWLRVFWVLATAAIAIVLMVTGGLTAIQTAAILTALPFSIVIIMMCFATAKAFHEEHKLLLRAQRRVAREEARAHIAQVVQTQVESHVQDSMAEAVQESVQEHYAENMADQVAEEIEAQLKDHLRSEAPGKS